MKQQRLVSVVIPAYNAAAFIERTLRSALRQTHSTLEVIVVDDGSTDSTEGLARAAAEGDSRVRIISVPNGGVASARNIGISEAAGEFVAFLDADDLWHPTKIEHQLAALDQVEDAAGAYVLSRHIDLNDRVIFQHNPILFSGYTFAQHLYCKPVGNGSSLLVRRKSAVAVGGFESSWAARGLGGCEDLDFELKLAAKYPIAAVPLYLVGYRESPGNMSSDKIRMARAAIETISAHIMMFAQLPAWAEKAALASTSGYALANYTKGRHWKLAMWEFRQLCRTDLPRAWTLSGWLVKDELRRLLTPIREGRSPKQQHPCFFDVDPASGMDVPMGRNVREQRIVQHLEALDAVLAKSVGEYGNQTTPQATAVSADVHGHVGRSLLNARSESP
jgi:glycosyltransferase involved in cell wall biosynthesis